MKTFEAIIFYRDSNKQLQSEARKIQSTSQADARKIAKRLAEEMGGRLFSLDRKERP